MSETATESGNGEFVPPTEQTIEQVGDDEWLGESGLVYIEKRTARRVTGKAMLWSFVVGIVVGAVIMALAGGGVTL